MEDDLARFEEDWRRFLAGELTEDEFKPRRAAWGVYEQRRDGTYMARVRIPGGVLPVEQADVLAGLAVRHGSGVLHITTRQALQFHDLEPGCVPGLFRELLAAGLTTRGGGGNTVRNVVTCPHAGVCPHEAFDVTPYALAVTEYLMGRADSFTLPRKFKIAFSGCGRDCALACATDVGFVARWAEGKPGFGIHGAGGLGAESRVADRLAEWLPASEVLRVAESLRRIFDRQGDRTNRRRARLRFVAAKLGTDAFRDCFRQELDAVAADVSACTVEPEAAGPRGYPAGGRLEDLMERREGFRVLPQRQAGLVTVVLAPPLGLLSGATLAILSSFARAHGAEQALRLLPNQQVAIRGVKPQDLPLLRKALEPVAPELLRAGALEAMIACTGASICRLGVGESRGVALACAAALDAAGLGGDLWQDLDIRINGCANACGQHPVGTIGCSGGIHRSDGQVMSTYKLVLGARRGEGQLRLGTPVATIPAKALPTCMVDLVRDFRAARLSAESFADYYDRRGADYFKALVAPHAR
jgi:sulfite reductase (ferredoxin)